MYTYANVSFPLSFYTLQSIIGVTYFTFYYNICGVTREQAKIYRVLSHLKSPVSMSSLTGNRDTSTWSRTGSKNWSWRKNQRPIFSSNPVLLLASAPQPPVGGWVHWLVGCAKCVERFRLGILFLPLVLSLSSFYFPSICLFT
jgi:hypothetical protein